MTRRSRRSRRELERELEDLAPASTGESGIGFVLEDAESEAWRDLDGNPVDDPDADMVFVLTEPPEDRP